MKDQFKIDWIDRGVEPKNQPNPNYPDGIDLDVSQGAAAACMAKLPYPAKRCGYYYVECQHCGANAMVTTAGRKDDPRALKLACYRSGLPQ